MRTLAHNLCMLCVVLAALALPHAAALQPVEGTEVVVTDAAGQQLVGYGVVKNGLLMLRLGASDNHLLLLLVGPDGTVQSMSGMRGAAGALLVDLPDGTRETLGAYLGKNDVALRILPQDGHRGTSQAEASPGAGGGTPASTSEPGSSDGSSGSSSGSGSSEGSSSDGSSSDAPSSDGSPEGGDVSQQALRLPALLHDN